MVKKDYFIPIRVTRRQKMALRRMAREADRDVSSIVREMIDDRLARFANDADRSIGCGEVAA